MAAEDSRDFVEPVSRHGLQRPGRPTVQLAAFGAQQTPVGGFLDDSVAKTVRWLTSAGQLLQETRATKFCQGRPELVARLADRGQ